MSVKKLSITIPTWNRCALLTELLEELIEQIEADSLQDDVDIIISDNGSEDTTGSVVKEYASVHSYIRYHTNGVNKGARYNVLKCFELGDSEFQMLFGDDDRPSKGSIKRVLDDLNKFPQTGLLFDSRYFKKNPFGDATLSLVQLLDNFYYYLGNAGGFIIRSVYLQEVLKKYPFEFFSPTWPQTQIFVISANNHPEGQIRISNLNVLTAGKHEEVMIYTSYYLWRTTYYDLIDAILVLGNIIDPESAVAARGYFRKNVNQLFFNILQCGVFVDERAVRTKTAKSIYQNLKKLSVKERTYMFIAASVLFLPAGISRLLSNLFIFSIRGMKGIRKKNEFVIHEMAKRERKKKLANNTIREFDFKNI